MSPRFRSILALTGLAALTACGASRAQRFPAYEMGPEAAKARARVDSARYPYTQADIDFMSGMIHHHAQAIVISKWAESQGASAAVQRLTARIINAQTDEISLMRTWLGDRNAPAPTVDSLGNVTMPGQASAMAAMPAMPAMPGMDHSAHSGHAMEMPGMLSAAQMDSLRAARGPTFDQRFLTYMIQHHRGAVTMVQTLFSHHGAGQNETIFKFAADVEVDQTTEIRRMLQMLLELDVPPPSQ